ncbi:hypothetical protein FJT64_017486 [Amphibalanus amphitrite]|uniref:Uncharacterized protein n=1 Tax=Amphibalanus amphitrite TaxID=1232801 RepID=A0A6A4WXA0_AMPAM|nr:hypothetical protein FJT64_017486 [Amphibalanus amphitrite]
MRLGSKAEPRLTMPDLRALLMATLLLALLGSAAAYDDPFIPGPEMASSAEKASGALLLVAAGLLAALRLL